MHIRITLKKERLYHGLLCREILLIYFFITHREFGDGMVV
jgi:hypothetical protein